MLRKIFFSLAAILLFFLCSNAQTDSASKKSDTVAKTPPPVAISGSVDVYYRYNFSGPPNQLTNNYTSFTNSQNSFELGMASLRADHSFGKVSATADLGFGRRAEEFSYNDAAHPTLFAVKQLFVAYQVSDKVKLTMGKWGTHIGYEVLDAFGNRNYSMDYMFSFGPFFHTGLKADVTLSGTTAFMVGVANPTDFSTTSSSTKVLIAQFSTGTKDGKLKAYLNYQGYSGVSQDTSIAPGYTLFKSLNQVDLVVNATITGQVGIGLNGTLQTVNSSTLGKTANWGGIAAYLNYDPTSTFGMTLRAEYFFDKDGIKINPVDLGPETPGLNVFDLTLSGICKVSGNLSIIPELRLDDGSKQFFYKSDGTTTKSTVSAFLAAVYKF
ncbi:MAG TPA: outer membrane beta-barrel protein [Puia sp.]|nr:outer membrane beta-barrel protein [Puia sp.]